MTFNRRSFLQTALAVSSSLGIPNALGNAYAAETDVIRFSIGKPAGDLNPHVYNGLWGVQDLMFEPLIGYGRGGKLVPALATSWEIKDGGRLLRLKLREGVTFQDGTPWNADAMKWNLERWIHLEDHAWMNHVRLFDGLNIIDDHTVEMKFKEAPLSLLYELSYTRPVRYLSPKSVVTDGSYQSPIGTGPWVQVAASDSGSDFERFDGYWGEKPAFKRIELKVLPDSRGRMAAIRAGEIDVTGGDFFAALTAPEAETLKNAGIAIKVTSGIAMHLGFNPDRAPALADKRVRKAISIGFDRGAIAKVLYRGLAEPAGSMFPPSVPLSGRQFPPDMHDVSAAKALLEEAGWKGDDIREKDGAQLTLELVVSEEQIAGSRSMAEVMQAQFREIGIDLKIRSVDHASRHSDIPARKYDIALFLTYGAPYDPFGTMVGYLVSTYDNGVDGKLVVNPEHLDPLMKAATSSDEANSAKSLQAVFDWLNAETAFAPVLYTPSIWAHSPRVDGFQSPATEYDTPYEGLHVEHG
jgi:nickel transport system substrate-binding protein